jgi:hypothetical protein
MTVAGIYLPSGRAESLRERLIEMRDENPCSTGCARGTVE